MARQTRSSTRVRHLWAAKTGLGTMFIFLGACLSGPSEEKGRGESDMQPAIGAGEVEKVASGLQAEQHLTFSIPERTGPNDFVIVTRDNADIADHVSLVTTGAGHAKVASSGSLTTKLGVESHTGTVISAGKVFLSERAHVHGDLTTASTIDKQSDTQVDGTQTQNAGIAFKPFDVVTAFPNTAKAAITVSPNRTLVAPIAPDYYSGLTVFNGSTVTLKSGSYFFDTFQIEPGATVKLDDAVGPIYLYVRQSFMFKGQLQHLQVGHPQLLLGYLGTSQVFVGGPFRGTILAPHAQINLATVGAAGHEGAFFGKQVLVNPDVRVVHRPFSWLIGGVTVDKTTPCAGDTVTVTVNASNPSDKAKPPAVTINSAPGSKRLVQMPPSFTGRRAISVAASAAGVSESRLVFVDVQACASAPPRPDIQFENNSYRENVVEFGVRNAAAFAGTGTVYHWDFGDGTAADSAYPAISHSYANAIKRDTEFNPFDLRVTIRRPGQPDTAAATTVTLWNAYAYNKARGTLRPSSETTMPGATFTGAAQISVKNLESEALRFSLRRIDRQLCAGAAAPQYGTFETVNFTVAAGATAAHAISIPTASMTGVCSVAIHLVGTTATTLRPVSVDGYLVIPGARPLALSAAAQGVLSYVADRGLAANPTRITDEELTRLSRQGRLPIADLVGPNAPQPPIRVLAGAGDPAGDALGTSCVPGQAPPRPGLSCQRTGWTKDTVPQIANALRGDVILSRGCGFVGGMLARVVPAQKWSHTGIMIENYTRLRQSTGMEEYVQDHPNGDFDQPTDGFEEHAIKYVWPGTVDSEVRQAYETGLVLNDPDGKERHVKGFSHRAVRCEEDGVLVFPHVLKPTAERDAEVRPQLFKLVDATAQVQGHYRFFGYSDGTVTSTPRAPAWVQAKPTPGVCSLLLWTAAKRANLTLDADKSNNVPGTEVGPNTPDGLYFYRADERRSAADFLYSQVYDDVDQAIVHGADKLGVDVARTINHGLGYLLGLGFATTLGWTSDMRDDVANQMVNCFASDFCSEDAKDSEDWKSPGDGQAVSPDDLLSWDFFAQHIEPVVYRTGENAAVYTWEASPGTGTVCGRVLLDGNPVAGATVVSTDNPLPAISQADGSFRFPATNAGAVTVTATKYVGNAPSGELLSGKSDLQVVPGSNACVDVVLQRPNLDFRRVFMDGTLFVHDEGDENANASVATEFFTGLGQAPETRSLFNKCAGDETRINVSGTVTYVGQGAVQVDLDMQMHEGSCFLCNACNNNDLDGRRNTALLLCDDSSTPEACQALATQLGLSTFAVKEFTLTGFRVDNTDENSGEFGEIKTLTMINFRQ